MTYIALKVSEFGKKFGACLVVKLFLIYHDYISTIDRFVSYRFLGMTINSCF